MAETYKGLTIRIGGDTTRLQSAMKSAESAISSTQSQLNKLNRALKFDGNDVAGVSRQLELMGNKAAETYTAINRLKSNIDQISGQKVKLFDSESAKTVGQLASETKDASARAAEALARYNELDGALERIYRSINKAAKESGEFDKSFDMRDAVRNLEDIEGKLLETGAATEEQIAKIKELRPLWKDAFDENEIAKSVQGFEQANDRLQALKASAKQTATEFTQLSQKMNSLNMRTDIDDRIDQLAEASRSATQNLERLQKAAKLDPGNFNTFKNAMDGFNEAISTAEKRAQLLSTRIDQLEASGISKAASDMGDLSERSLEARAALEKANAAVSEMEGNLREARSQMDLMESRGDSTSEQFKEQKLRVSELEGELQQLVARQREANETVRQFQGAEQMREYKTQLSETEAQISKLNAEQKELSSAGGFLGLGSNALMEMGMVLSTTVTPAVMGLGSYAIDAARDIDSAYRDMRKTVSGTEQDFVDLKNAAIDFSLANVTSADTMLSIQAIGGELGVATEDLKTFSETVANLDVATNINAEDAATALGQLSNIMNDLDGSTMPRFADALVRLGNNGASTESQIVDIAARIGSMGSIVGMTTPQVLAWASTIASTGQNAEAAGTAIANTMSDLEQAVAKGGDSLEAFAQVSQMTAEEFASTWESDPSTAMKAFIEGLIAIEENGGSATATLDELGIRASRQVQAIEGLMQSIGLLDDSLEMSQNAWDGVSDQWGEAGDAANEASKKAEGFSGSLSILANTAQVFGSELGESMAPFISWVSEQLSELTAAFSGLPPEIKTATVVAGGFAAALGPSLLFIRSSISAINDLKSAITKIGGANQIVNALSTSFGGLAGVVAVLGAAGIGAIAAEMMRVQKYAEDSKRATDGFSDSIQELNTMLYPAKQSVDDFSDALYGEGYTAENAVEANLELADSIRKVNEEASGHVNSLEGAKSVLEKYMNQSGLTASEQGLLVNAIKTVNDECGTQYEVVDAANGKIADEKGVILETCSAIDEYIEKKQQMIRVDALSEDLTNAQNTYQSNLKEREKAEAAYWDKVEWYREKYGRVDASDQYSSDITRRGDFGQLMYAYDEYQKASKALDQSKASLEGISEELGLLQSDIDGTASEIESFVVNSGVMAEGLKGTGKNVVEFSKALEDAGVSIGTLNTMGDEELMDLAMNFDGTIASIMYALDEMGVQMPAKGLQAMFGFSEGITEGTVYAINAAMTAQGITLQQFQQYTEQYGLTGQEQIAAFANALASGDTYGAAAIAAYGGVEGVRSMLSEYGLTGDAAISAFISALNNGDTLQAALEKAEQAAQGIEQGGNDMEAEAQNAADDTTNALGNVGDVSGEYASMCDGIIGVLSSKRRTISSLAASIASDAQRALATGVSTGGGTSLSGALSVGRRSAVPSAATQASGISLMSADMPSVPSAGSYLPAPSALSLAENAARIAQGYADSYVTNVSRGISGALGSSGSSGVSRIPLVSDTTNVNVTIDGTGTTTRVEQITLQLLDELERLGAI